MSTACSNPCLSASVLRSAAEASLSCFLEPNAVFLAEQLHLLHPSAESAHLLASAHLRCGNLSRAAAVLVPARTPENRYLYAVCQTRIGTSEALRDAEAHLRMGSPLTSLAWLEASTNTIAGGAAGIHLLATICQRTGRAEEAASLYKRAVKDNPTLWVAFEALAKMGKVAKAADIITGTDAQLGGKLETKATAQEIKGKERRVGGFGVQGVQQDRSRGLFHTPSPMRALPFADMKTPVAPLGGLRGRRGMRLSTPGSSAGRRATRRDDQNEEVARTQLFATPKNGAEPSMQVTDAKTADGRGRRRSQKEKLDELQMSAMDLLRAIGQIVADLGRYRCSQALHLAHNLPSKLRDSSYIRSLRGRAYLENGTYTPAQQEFEKIITSDPTCIQGVVEYYSTVLWHMKRDKELARLAIHVQKVYPISPSAWCAVGNCFSLQRDHDVAIKFFNKALATSPEPNAYPYTLLGHEYMMKEQFDDALTSYRQALVIDERHYNAIYGIGQVLLKQEKFGPAQNHFRNAILIHPTNSNLHYHLGMALAAEIRASGADEDDDMVRKGSLQPALKAFEEASKHDRNNPVPKFEKARILVSLGRLHEAQMQLLRLRESLPKEPALHYELSRIHAKMGEKQMAIQDLSHALDLDPKERKYKKALETLTATLTVENAMDGISPST